MEMDLEETIKGLLLKNIVTECRLDTLTSCLVNILCDQNGITVDAAIKIIDTVCDGFMEKQKNYNPLFQEHRKN